MSGLSHNSSAAFKMMWAVGSGLHGSTTVFLAANETSWPSTNNHTLTEIISSYWISSVARI